MGRERQEIGLDETHSLAEDDLRGRSIRGASALMVGQVFRFAISMGSQIYLARLLFPADFGLLAMVYPVLGFVQLFADFGLLQAVVQRRTLSQPLLSAVFWINVAISLGLTLLFAGLAPVLGLFYHDSRIVPVALVLSTMIFVSGLGQLQGALLNRQLRFGTLVSVEITVMLLGLAASVAGAHAGLGYWSLVIGQCVTTCANTVLQTMLSGWRPSAPRREAAVLSMLRFGSQITGSKLVGYLNLTVDNVMVGARLGEVSLGLYSRAWGLAAQPLAQLSAPVDRLAIPILSRVQDDPDRYRRVFGQMVQTLCLLTMPGLVFGVVAADGFIPYLLGSKWHDIIPIFRWVCIGAVISPLNLAAMWLFISQSRGSDHLTFSALAAVINIMAYAVGLHWGVEGVAMSSALSVYLLQCPMLVIASTRRGLLGRAQFLQSVAPVILAVAAMTPLLYLFSQQVEPSSLGGIVVDGACAYAMTGLLLGCFPAGRQTLATTWMLAPARLKAQVEMRLFRPFRLAGSGA